MPNALRRILMMVALSACGVEKGRHEPTCLDYAPIGIGEPCRKGFSCECTAKCVSRDLDEARCYPIIEPEEECTSYTDCYSAYDETAICATRDAACPGGVKRVCAHGCNGDQDCPETMQCLTLNSHQCVPRPCWGSCPKNFTCNAEDRCVRRVCESDKDCPEAYCVEGRCHAELGICTDDF